MILMKLGEEYKLYSHDSCIATTKESPYKRLSKQNCDEIFGVVDVEILSDEYSHDSIWFNKRGTYNNQEFFEFIAKKSFMDGFNKAIELNKDKLFTIEDIQNILKSTEDLFYQTLDEDGNVRFILDEEVFTKSTQHPTEIEVEIEMVCPHPSDTYKCGLEFGCDEDGCNNPNQIPYLDENGRLILKKK